MRQFAGFGTAEDTNERFKELLRAGGDGLSTAFDMPTLMGRDSDDPLAKGEVGRCRRRRRHPGRHGDLFAGIDLGAVTTSMTINSPAADRAGDVRGVGRRERASRATGSAGRSRTTS